MLFCPAGKVRHISSSSLCSHTSSCALSLLLSFGNCSFAYLRISTCTRCLGQNSKLLLLACLAKTELLNKFINSFIYGFQLCMPLSQFPKQVELRISDKWFEMWSEGLFKLRGWAGFAQLLTKDSPIPQHVV